MNADSPFEDAVPDDGDEPPYEWLDEWLCEYVDGTMDPSLEAVFEQYVEANPELKAHVRRLEETRELLCNCGLPKEASPDTEAEVCREVECDMPQSSVSARETVPNRPVAALGLASSVVVALVVGFLAGATVVNPPVSPDGTAPGNRVASDAEPAPSLQRAQRTSSEGGDLRRRSVKPFPAVDSTRHRFPLPTIGSP